MYTRGVALQAFQGIQHFRNFYVVFVMRGYFSSVCKSLID